MRIFNCAVGQTFQFDDISVTVLNVDDDEVLLGVDCPEGVICETGNSDSPATFIKIEAAAWVARHRFSDN